MISLRISRQRGFTVCLAVYKLASTKDNQEVPITVTVGKLVFSHIRNTADVPETNSILAYVNAIQLLYLTTREKQT